MYSSVLPVMPGHEVDEHEGRVITGIGSKAGRISEIEAGIGHDFFEFLLGHRLLHSRSMSATMAVVFSIREPSGAVTSIVKFPASTFGKNSVCRRGSSSDADDEAARASAAIEHQRLEAKAGAKHRSYPARTKRNQPSAAELSS